MKRQKPQRLGTVQKKVVAAPIDTFVTPVTPQVRDSSGLDKLAEGLSGISKEVGAYYIEKRKKDEAEQRKSWEVQIQGKLDGLTFTEAQKLRKEGKLAEVNDPWYQKTMEHQYGVKMARHRRDDMLSRINGVSTAGEGQPSNAFDPVNGDIEQWLAETSQEDTTALVGNEAAMGGYLSTMGRVREQLNSAGTRAKLAEAKRQNLETVYGNIMEEVKVGAEQGASPEQVYKNIRSHFSNNEKLLGVSKKEQDAELVKAAEVLAEQGHVDLVEKIFTDKRGGVGSLGDTREYAAKALKLREKAQKVSAEHATEAGYKRRVLFKEAASDGALDEKALDADPSLSQSEKESLKVQNHNAQRTIQAKSQYVTQYTQQEQAIDSTLLRLVQDGQLHKLGSELTTDPRTGEPLISKTGTEKAYTKEQLRTRAANLLEKMTTKMKMTHAQTVQLFAKSGLPHPVWQQALKDGAGSLTVFDASKGIIPPALKDALSVYKQIKAVDAGYFVHIKADQSTMDFYENVRIAEELDGQSLEQAVASAQAIRANDVGIDVKARQVRYSELESMVNALKKKPVDWGIDTSVDNAFELAGRAESLGRYYINRGYTPKQAFDRAVDRVQSESVVVNGSMVPLRAGMSSDFKQHAISFINELQLPDGMNHEDVTVYPVGTSNDVFQVHNKTTMTPVILPGGKFVVTSDEMAQADDRRKEVLHQEAAAQINEKKRTNKRITFTQRARNLRKEGDAFMLKKRKERLAKENNN